MGNFVSFIFHDCAGEEKPTSYTHINQKMLPGKNKYISLVASKSRKTSYKNKIWVNKPFFFKDEKKNYQIEQAARELFFGNLAVALYGKNYAPKVKFNFNKPGIVCRVIGDDFSRVKDLSSLFSSSNIIAPLTTDVQQQLLRFVIYSIMIRDHDADIANLVAVYKQKNGITTITQIYGIDHEFACIRSAYPDVSSTIILSLIYSNPQYITEIIINSAFGWINKKKASNYSSEIINKCHKTLLPDITPQMILEECQTIYAAITAYDFRVLNQVRTKILEDFINQNMIYNKSLLDIQTTIKHSIKNLKENLQDIDKFIKNPQIYCITLTSIPKQIISNLKNSLQKTCALLEKSDIFFIEDKQNLLALSRPCKIFVNNLKQENPSLICLYKHAAKINKFINSTHVAQKMMNMQKKLALPSKKTILVWSLRSSPVATSKLLFAEDKLAKKYISDLPRARL